MEESRLFQMENISGQKQKSNDIIQVYYVLIPTNLFSQILQIICEICYKILVEIITM